MRSLLGRFHRPMSRGLVNNMLTMNNLGDGSTLSLDFTTGVLDSRLTFTRSTTATYINSSGYVTTAAANAPRFDYSPTNIGEPRGLLIEGQAINLLKNSAYADSNWIAFGGFTKPSPYVLVTSPANDLTASKLNFTSTDHGLYTNNTQMGYTNTVGATYTQSAWIRATGGTNNPNIRFGDSASGFSPNIPITTTWTRYSYSYTAVSNSGPTLASASIGGHTGEFEMWGFQLELGSGASSYIPTGASQVTRNADVCYIANADYAFSTSGGTYLAEWNRGSNITIGSSGNQAFATDYASGRWLGVYTTGASSTATAGSWSGYLNATGAVSGINKMAVSYSSWDASASGNTSLNGGAIVSGTLTLGTTPTYLFVGAASATAPYNGGGFRDPLNNCVRRIKYWPTALPNAQLQALTTP